MKFIPKSLILELFVNNFSSFLYCCSKNTNSTNSLESQILERCESNVFLTLSRRLKIIYLIFNKSGIPSNVAKVRKYSYESMEDITNSAIKKYKGIFKHDKRISYEKWIDGRVINVENNNEIISAIKKIFEFQNSTKGNKLSIEEIEAEIKEIKEFFKKNVPEVLIYDEWTKDYKNYLQTKSVFKTSVHGDLSAQNILVNERNKELFLIDWESLDDIGNPLLDLIRFIFRTLVSRKQNKIEDFEKKIFGKDKKFNHILNRIEIEFQNQFGFKLNFLILIRIHLLNDIITKKKRDSNIRKNLELIEILKKVNVSEDEKSVSD